MFVNIEAKKDKPVRSKIICPYCRDESLKLRWHQRNSQGKAEYWDLTTDSLHLCKSKGVTCKFCQKDGLQWKKSVDTKSGVELVDAKGKLHNCKNRAISDYISQLEYFFDKIVILDSDPETTKAAKRALQDRMKGNGYVENVLKNRTPEEIRKYTEFMKLALKHTFNSK